MKVLTSMLYMNRVGTVSLGPEGAADLRPTPDQRFLVLWMVGLPGCCG